MLSENALRSQLFAAASLWDDLRDAPQPVDRRLGGFFHRHRKKFGSRDRRFLSETIYALFRHRAFIETWAAHLGSTDSLSLATLAALRVSLVLESFPEAVRLFRDGAERTDFLEGHTPASFRPGSEIDEISIRYSFPSWLIERWLPLWGKDRIRSLLVSMLQRPVLSVRANTLKISREGLIKRFGNHGFKVRPSSVVPTGILFDERVNVFELPEFREGFFEVQDEASQCVGAVLSPSPTDWIWDMCAGGGGKSLHLAAIMNNQGRVVATDIHAWKLDELKKRAKRAGVYNIFPADLNRLQEIRTVRETGFDKILVDAPCSGTGTIRRNPDLKWKLKPDDFSSHHRDQIELVRRALPLLRPGGKLYYATCSLDPEENESVIREAIEAEKVKAVELAWPGAEPADPCGLRFRPDAGETDGFFLAGLEKL